MTPEEIRLVGEVATRAMEAPDFAARFYSRLFEETPAAASMFGDLEAQQAKLADELGAMVSMLGDLPSLEARAHELGQRHVGYGVRAVHYRLARDAMRDALTEVLGDDFGPDERAAWARATTLITELMQS